MSTIQIPTNHAEIIALTNNTNHPIHLDPAMMPQINAVGPMTQADFDIAEQKAKVVFAEWTVVEQPFHHEYRFVDDLLEVRNYPVEYYDLVGGEREVRLSTNIRHLRNYSAGTDLIETFKRQWREFCADSFGDYVYDKLKTYINERVYEHTPMSGYFRPEEVPVFKNYLTDYIEDPIHDDPINIYLTYLKEKIARQIKTHITRRRLAASMALGKQDMPRELVNLILSY